MENTEDGTLKLEKKLIGHAAILVVVLFFVNYFAMKFHIYTALWHFDMWMHFAGGVFLGLVTLYVVMRLKVVNPLDLGSTFLISLVLSFLLMLFWEVFEAGLDVIFNSDQHFLLDTISDVFFGIAGVALAGMYYLRKHKQMIRVK